MKFRVKYALGGGFGGTEMADEEILEFKDQRDAEEYAYEKACEEYEMYEGMHGLLTTEEIIEEEGCGYKEALEIYIDERDSWLDYWVKPVDEKN